MLRWSAALKSARQILVRTSQKRFDSNAGTTKNEVLAEDKIAALLKTNFPNATFIEVADISGGCGAMFEVSVEAAVFKGLSIVKQHRLVNDALNEQIKSMHGIRIRTAVPANS